jgi:peroxiredoxin
VIGISTNVTFSQKAFADFLKLNFPLLSDARDLKAVKAYGVLNEERRTARRSYFIVDKDGVIRFKKIMPTNSDLLPNDEILKEIKKINQAA